MPKSARERAIIALETAAKATGAVVWREADTDRDVPPEGMIQLAEAEYQPEAILSPLSYAHEFPVDVILTVTAADEGLRDAALDLLLLAFSVAATADTTLGGEVEFIELGAPAFIAFEGDGAGKAARLTATLCFTTAGTPLT